MFDESNINSIKVADVGIYRIYLSDNEAIFGSAMSAIRGVLTNYRTIDVKNTGYTIYKDMDITQEPECELKDDGNGQYCVFKYTVKNLDGTDAKIQLEDNKAYYLQDKKKFIYIISGTDLVNKLNDNIDKYILVTAVDIDGNEINNVDPKQKITKGQNLLTIKPQDWLAPGFVKIESVIWEVPPIPSIKLVVKFDRPKVYIDGSVLPSTIPLTYQIYDKFTCNNNVNTNSCTVQPPYAPLYELTSSTDAGPLSADILKTAIPPGTDKIGAMAVIDKGNSNYKQYYDVFTQSIVPAIIP